MLQFKALKFAVCAGLLTFSEPSFAYVVTDTTVNIFGTVTSVSVNGDVSCTGDCGSFTLDVYRHEDPSIGLSVDHIIGLGYDTYCDGSYYGCHPAPDLTNASVNIRASGGSINLSTTDFSYVFAGFDVSYGDQGGGGNQYYSLDGAYGNIIYYTTSTLETTSYTYNSVTTFIPEPSTWVTALLGFTGLGFVGYRRARAGQTIPAAVVA
jgi:hypothetical protein